MEFNVLGPVTVTSGYDSLNIGGPKQRTVLAMLISRAGQSLTADAIAQAVYGEDTPTKGRRMVQTYVSALRSAVGDVIVKDGAAWSLQADRAMADITRFEDLYESARNLSGDAVSEVLREALAIWRGDPYSDVEARGELAAIRCRSYVSDAFSYRLAEEWPPVLHSAGCPWRRGHPSAPTDAGRMLPDRSSRGRTS